MGRLCLGNLGRRTSHWAAACCWEVNESAMHSLAARNEGDCEMTVEKTAGAQLHFLESDAGVASVMRGNDWSASPLGNPEIWPQSLRAVVGLMLGSKFPMFAAWGDGLGLIYNDAYAQILGAKHPKAMGRRFIEVWPEIWSDISPSIEAALDGRASYFENLPLVVSRNGIAENTWFTFSYSPLRDDDGHIGGMFCVCTETTAQVLSEFRMQAQKERQQRLFEKAPGFIAILTGPDLVFEFVNEAYAELFSRRDYVGRPVRDVFHDLEGQGIFELLEAVYTSGERFLADAIPVRLQPLPGEAVRDFRLDFIYEPIRDDHGQVTGIFVQGNDVTQRTLAEEALRASLTEREAAHAALAVSEARLRFLHRLAEETAPLANADDVMEVTTRLLGQHLDLANCAYADMDEDEDGFTIRGDWAAPGSSSIVGHYSLADFGTLAVTRLGAGKPLIINDNQQELAPHEAAAFQNIGIAATICMPLVKDGRLTALMAIHDRQPRLWTPEELNLLGEVTSRSWAHIERVGAIAELRESEARLRALNVELERRVVERTQARGLTWQVSPDLMGALTSEGYFKTSNPAWQTVLGWSEDEVSRTPIWEFLHPDDLEASRKGFALTQVGQPAIKFPNRYRCKNGSYRWISWVGVPEGGLVYCTGRDITDEVEREAELAARTAERDRLWMLSQDMFARANLQGMMSAVSPSWTKVLGWSEDELLSRPYATFMHDEDMGPTLAALAGMGETGAPTRFENRIATKAGGWKPIEWTVAPEPDGRNFIAVGRDLSGMKAREAELSAAQDALRQSQKMEAVGQLTGGLAHDFNNIIAGISGSLQMMSIRLAQGRVSDLDRYITGAAGAAKRAAGLTQRLLAFSRRQTLDPKPTDVNALIKDMLDLVHRSMGPEIHVETSSAVDLWTTLVDGGQLENALLNLCINARDAMPDGGTLTIETSNRWMDEHAARLQALAPGQYVSLCVSDTGTGMAPEVIERAFDPFFTTKPIGQGTGLGLSMVYGFAGQSGGAVRIYSELGKGTSVCIYLPRHAGDASIPLLEQAAEAPQSTGRETILLVDDEPLVRMIAAEALTDLGYTVIEAAEGATALKVLASQRAIDLLVTDVGLPGGTNGRQVADAARVTRPDLKVLFITGYAENAVLNHGHLERGMHLLTKPFAMDAFARKVRDLIAEG